VRRGSQPRFSSVTAPSVNAIRVAFGDSVSTRTELTPAPSSLLERTSVAGLHALRSRDFHWGYAHAGACPRSPHPSDRRRAVLGGEPYRGIHAATWAPGHEGPLESSAVRVPRAAVISVVTSVHLPGSRSVRASPACPSLQSGHRCHGIVPAPDRRHRAAGRNPSTCTNAQYCTPGPKTVHHA